MDETGGQEPVKRETARLADLPVEGLPEDAPEAAYAATDEAPADLDPVGTAHDPEAERGPKAVMTAYADALGAGDAGLAADLYAENSLLTSADERISGRPGITGWHEDLLRRGPVTARPAGQGNDRSRLEVDSAAGRFVVELAFDASGRIGTARWLIYFVTFVVPWLGTGVLVMAFLLLARFAYLHPNILTVGLTILCAIPALVLAVLFTLTTFDLLGLPASLWRTRVLERIRSHPSHNST